MKPTPEQTIRIAHSIAMSGFMSTALSGVFSWLEFGFSMNWLMAWGNSIMIAWPIVLGLDTIFGGRIRAATITLISLKYQSSENTSPCTK